MASSSDHHNLSLSLNRLPAGCLTSTAAIAGNVGEECLTTTSRSAGGMMRADEDGPPEEEGYHQCHPSGNDSSWMPRESGTIVRNCLQQQQNSSNFPQQTHFSRSRDEMRGAGAMLDGDCDGNGDDDLTSSNGSRWRRRGGKGGGERLGGFANEPKEIVKGIDDEDGEDEEGDNLLDGEGGGGGTRQKTEIGRKGTTIGWRRRSPQPQVQRAESGGGGGGIAQTCTTTTTATAADALNGAQICRSIGDRSQIGANNRLLSTKSGCTATTTTRRTPTTPPPITRIFDEMDKRINRGKFNQNLQPLSVSLISNNRSSSVSDLKFQQHKPLRQETTNIEKGLLMTSNKFEESAKTTASSTLGYEHSDSDSALPVSASLSPTSNSSCGGGAEVVEAQQRLMNSDKANQQCDKSRTSRANQVTAIYDRVRKCPTTEMVEKRAGTIGRIGLKTVEQTRNRTVSMGAGASAVERDQRRVGDLIRQFNALDNGQLPVPESTSKIHCPSVSPSRMGTSGSSRALSVESPSSLMENDTLSKNFTTASSIDCDESQTADCISSFSLASQPAGSLMNFSRFEPEKIIGRNVASFPHSSDSELELDVTDKNAKLPLPPSRLPYSSSITSPPSAAISPFYPTTAVLSPQSEQKASSPTSEASQNSRRNRELEVAEEVAIIANNDVVTAIGTISLQLRPKASSSFGDDGSISTTPYSPSSPVQPYQQKNHTPYQQQTKPSWHELDSIRTAIGVEEYSQYSICSVLLHRPSGITEGSVGLLLTEMMPSTSGPSKQSDKSFKIMISKVTSGSVADRDGRLMMGDRVFFIQHQSTGKMPISDARLLLRSAAPSIHLVVGRRRLISASPHHLAGGGCLGGSNQNLNALISSSSTSSLAMSEQDEKFSSDPALERYNTEPIIVTLQKSGSCVVGLSFDGGRGSRFGDRPIIVKKIVAASEAARDGHIAVGDEIRQIDDIELFDCSRAEAFRILQGRPNGPIKLTVFKRIC